MNGTLESLRTLVATLNAADLDPEVEVVVSPPSIYLYPLREVLRKDVEVAAQNSFDKPNGAFTGEISVEHLKDVGVTWSIIGHSERRAILREGSQFIASKTKYALDNGLGVILCIGENLEQRESGKTIPVCEAQLDPVIELVKDWSNVVVAYEPVWAIGTGKVATPEQAEEVHADIRSYLGKKVGKDVAENIRIIYGGSVAGKNCKSFLPKENIDGFLVGGASLKPEFIDIINCHR